MTKSEFFAVQTHFHNFPFLCHFSRVRSRSKTSAKHFLWIFCWLDTTRCPSLTKDGLGDARRKDKPKEREWERERGRERERDNYFYFVGMDGIISNIRVHEVNILYLSRSVFSALYLWPMSTHTHTHTHTHTRTHTTTMDMAKAGAEWKSR